MHVTDHERILLLFVARHGFAAVGLRMLVCFYHDVDRRRDRTHTAAEWSSHFVNGSI